MRIDIMKILTLCVLMISIIAISGCTSNLADVSEQSNKNQENKSVLLPRVSPVQDHRTMNLSDVERQKLMEERKSNLSDMNGGRMQNNVSERPSFEAMQQKLLEACNGKKEGDSGKFTGPRGEETCTCKIQKDQLLCSPEGFKRNI